MQTIMIVPLVGGIPQFPTNAQHNYTLFDGDLTGWSRLDNDPPDATEARILVTTSEARMAELRALPTLSEPIYPALPASGWLDAGDIYVYGDDLLIVRQSHNRTEWPPEQTPALFSAYRVDTGTGVLAWVANETVILGDRRTYDGTVYECIQAHTTQSDWTPTATLGVLWQIYQEAPHSAWSYPVAYTGDNTAGTGNGDQVTYNGHLYRCLQSHTSQVTWTPDVTPALWLDLGAM
jgi:hypothetical protein